MAINIIENVILSLFFRVVNNAKIACLDFSLQKVKMKMGVQLLVSDVDQLDQMRCDVNRKASAPICDRRTYSRTK